MIANKANFLGLTGKYAQFETSKFVVLSISYNGIASYLKGTADTPRIASKIIANSTILH